MTLNEASNFFKSLITETTKKSEIPVYKKFNYILTKLQNRTFSNDEIRSIETELDSLNLITNPKDREKYFKNTLGQFEKYLKDTFSIISKGYYTNMGIGLGLSFGIIFGIVVLSGLERSLGIALGMSIGMFIGLIIGRSMESQAKAAGRIL